MSIKISAQLRKDLDIGSQDFYVDEIPDFCPICHKNIQPLQKHAWRNERTGDKELQIIFLCPNEKCQNLFISYYRQPYPYEMYFKIDYYYYKSAPGSIRKEIFPEEITVTSKKFGEIYNQAKEAESWGLREICGAGYRRALEFLIKDYLIKKKVGTRNKIEDTPLGACIDDFIESKNLKDCAKRAAWIGNDETHYIRKWKDKDLDDLKNLIQLTVNWIQTETLTEQIIKEMPDKKTGKK